MAHSYNQKRMEMHTDNVPAVWTTPQCTFAIEYSPRVLDDIRLAVMDAFFSLPRGGAEIGGVLVGSHAKGRVKITDYRALDCEHALGPGFTLSDRDKKLLAGLLFRIRNEDLEPVGWYHSHTRSEIFLSEPDLEVYNAYFPEPWQVALVIKPHTFHPPRAGFFFHEPGGSIHAAASYNEFQLEPLAVRQLPGSAPPPMIEPSREPPIVPSPNVITIAAQPVPAEPAPAPEPAASFEPMEQEPLQLDFVEVEAEEVQEVEPEGAPEPVEALEAEAPEAIEEVAEEPAAEPVEEPELHTDIPSFLQPKPVRSWKWLKPVAVIAGGLAVGSLAYITRQGWVPRVLAGFERLRSAPTTAAASPARPAAAPASIGLTVIDTDGQLQVHWDRTSASVRNGSHAVLEILDSGAALRALPLDDAHLESGTFTYARQGERVDVALAIDQPNGKSVRESTTFLGKLPDKPEDATALRRQRDDLARQNTQLAADLRTAVERARKADKALADLQGQVKQQQRRRLQNQVSK
jgi:hypothetical protein